jgi:hypothetical protein
VLICPGCQSSFDWAAALDRCPVCASARLVRRLGEIECRDCGSVHPPAGHATHVGPAVGGLPADPGQGGDSGLGGPGPGGPGAVSSSGPTGGTGSAGGGTGLGEREKPGAAAPPGLAEEVEQALERVLGRTRRTAGIG